MAASTVADKLSDAYVYLAERATALNKTQPRGCSVPCVAESGYECDLRDFFSRGLGQTLKQEFPEKLEGKNNVMILICIRQDPVRKAGDIPGVLAAGRY